MSSACVCHTEKWCFYCRVYSLVEDENELIRLEFNELRNKLSAHSKNVEEIVLTAQIEIDRLTEQLQSAHEEIEKLQKIVDAKLLFVSNGQEQDMYVLQENLILAIETLKQIHAYDGDMLDSVAISNYYEIKRRVSDSLHQLGVMIE